MFTHWVIDGSRQHNARPQYLSGFLAFRFFYLFRQLCWLGWYVLHVCMSVSFTTESWLAKMFVFHEMKKKEMNEHSRSSGYKTMTFTKWHRSCAGRRSTKKMKLFIELYDMSDGGRDRTQQNSLCHTADYNDPRWTGD